MCCSASLIYIILILLSRPKFGKLITVLDKGQFLDAIDKEDPNVTVVFHLYSEVNAVECCLVWMNYNLVLSRVVQPVSIYSMHLSFCKQKGK